jgi:hypothetical protein
VYFVFGNLGSCGGGRNQTTRGTGHEFRARVSGICGIRSVAGDSKLRWIQWPKDGPTDELRRHSHSIGCERANSHSAVHINSDALRILMCCALYAGDLDSPPRMLFEPAAFV